jgi:Protein of unknown function (DUF2800)
MLTASKLAIARRCPSAFALPHVDTPTPEADAGTDRHAEDEADINAGRVPDEYEQRWPGLSWRAEVAFTINVFTGAARELGCGINRDYSGVTDDEVCGTTDAVGVGNGLMVIVDRKGHAEVERAIVNAQLHIAALTLSRIHRPANVVVAIRYEAKPMDVAEPDLIDLEGFALELRELVMATRLAIADSVMGKPLRLVEGDHCRYCPAFLAGCPAKGAFAKQAESGELMARVEAMIPFATPEDAARAYQLAENVAMFKKRLDAALYAYASETPIPVAPGRVFGARKKLGNEVLDADIVYATVREVYGQEVADQAIERKATKTRLKGALEIVVGKGAVASAERKLLAVVKERGGVERKEKTVVEEFDVQQQLKGVG